MPAPSLHRTAILSALLLASTGVTAHAQQREERRGVELSGILFANYQYLLGGPGEDFNQFAIDRAYLTVRAAVAPRTSVRSSLSTRVTRPSRPTSRSRRSVPLRRASSP